MRAVADRLHIGGTIVFMKPRVYLETTIPSYLSARPSRDLVRAARQQITREWWERRHEYEILISQLVVRDAGFDPPAIFTPEEFLGDDDDERG